MSTRVASRNTKRRHTSLIIAGRRACRKPMTSVDGLLGTLNVSSVAGLTGNTSAQRRRGISEDSAANQNRSADS